MWCVHTPNAAIPPSLIVFWSLQGCAGQDGCPNSDCGEREGGAGGGASAVTRGQTVLLVAGGSGGQAGGDDNAITMGGHGGGVSGATGGTTVRATTLSPLERHYFIIVCSVHAIFSDSALSPVQGCNDDIPGGRGGTQREAGTGGLGNRGYNPGSDGSGHDGGHGGGTDTLMSTTVSFTFEAPPLHRLATCILNAHMTSAGRLGLRRWRVRTDRAWRRWRRWRRRRLVWRRGWRRKLPRHGRRRRLWAREQGQQRRLRADCLGQGRPRKFRRLGRVRYLPAPSLSSDCARLQRC